MPDIDPCRIYDEFDQEQIASIVFNDSLIEDNFPSTQPDTRGWGDVCILPRAIKARFKRTAFVDYQEEFDSTENRDTITQTNLVNSEVVLVQELIYRIKILYYDAKEEDPECVGIAAESLRSFNDFIHLHTNLKRPIISLTPDYNIYASWRDEQNRVFSIHFLPNADVRFVMFKPNVKRPGRKIRVSGSATIDTLMETVDPDCLEEWISE